MGLSITGKRGRRGTYHLLDGVWCDLGPAGRVGGGLLSSGQNTEKDVSMDFNRFRRWVFWCGISGAVFLVGVIHSIGQHYGVFR